MTRIFGGNGEEKGMVAAGFRLRSIWLLSVIAISPSAPPTSAGKLYYTPKSPNVKSFRNFFLFCRIFRQSRISRPFLRHSKILVIPAFPVIPAQAPNQLDAGRRMLRRKPRYSGDFISPSFPRRRESTLLPFCYFAKAQTGDSSPKMANHNSAGNSAAKGGATHSRIFPSCFARWFALRANSKNPAPINRLRDYDRAKGAVGDSRLRGNDNWRAAGMTMGCYDGIMLWSGPYGNLVMFSAPVSVITNMSCSR